MVQDGGSSILLGLVVLMISVLVMSFFTANNWSEFGRAGKKVAVAVRDSVSDNEEMVKESEEGRVLGVSVRPVDFIGYPVVHISSGERNVFELQSGD